MFLKDKSFMLLSFGVSWFLNTPVVISFQFESSCKYSRMAKSTRLPNSGSELELTGDRGMYPVPLLLCAANGVMMKTTTQATKGLGCKCTPEQYLVYRKGTL